MIHTSCRSESSNFSLVILDILDNWWKVPFLSFFYPNLGMLSHLKILYLLSLKNLLWACEILFETQFGKKSTWQHWVAKLVKLNKRYPTLYIANCTNPMYENSQHVTSACHQTSKLFQHSLNPYSVYLSDKKNDRERYFSFD